MATQNDKKNIVIIGGGIIGCTSAYYLTRHPSFDPSKHTITLLEASSIAGGASGKAGGLLGLWAYPSSLVPLSYRLHKELADEHNGEERWGYRAVHCAQVDCVGKKPEKNSSISNGSKGEDVSLQKRSKEALGKLRAAGVPKELDWIDPESLKYYEEMGTPSTTAQVHPFQFTTSMAELAREAGVDIKTHSPVDKINYTPDGSAVQSVTYTSTSPESNTKEQHTIIATDIILAAGPWTQRLLPSAPISALRAHSVTIRPSRPVSAYCLFTEIKLKSSGGSRSSETVSPEIYARPNNEVYACGEGDHLVPLPALSSDVSVDAQRCEEIAAHVGAVSAELRGGEITARQACYLPNVSSPRAAGPLVGFTRTKGLVMAAGHTCWGIQNGPGTGKLVSEFVFEGEGRSAKVAGLDPRVCL